MPLTEDQEEKFNVIVAESQDELKKLNDWERGFLKDQIERYEKYGAGLSLSPKQWNVLNKIHEKVTDL